MAAVNWLCVPLKRSSSSEIDFRKPLEKFIKSTFSEDMNNDLRDSIGELNKLRCNAVNRAPERHQSSLDTLLRYLFVISHSFTIYFYDELCFNLFKNFLTKIRHNAADLVFFEGFMGEQEYISLIYYFSNISLSIMRQ